MIYSKRALTVEKQADLLLRRGLIGNRAEIIERLKAVNYYRLSGYLYPFRQPGDSFVPGTAFDAVWRRYNFDRRLRMLLLDAIERIEVAVRTRVVYNFVINHGPFGHLEPKNLPGFKRSKWGTRLIRNLKRLAQLKGWENSEHAKWVGKLKNEKNRARDEFVRHFDTAYGDSHEDLPLWMAAELMTCETVQQLIQTMEPSLIKQVAADFGFPDQQFLSWAKAVFSLRNGCAHHARIWNRVFGVKPSIPGKNKNPEWHTDPGFATDRIGLLLTVCHHWLGKISPTTQWRQRVFALFDEYPDIPTNSMGLPPLWRTHALWQTARSDSGSIPNKTD
jgi:abortive infection bacteriophage resistance protein